MPDEAEGFLDRGPGAVALEQAAGSGGKLLPGAAALALHASDLHVVVARGLMAQPRDGRGFDALLEGNALRASDGAAADGRGVLGDEIREGRGFAFEGGMEGEEADDGVTSRK